MEYLFHNTVLFAVTQKCSLLSILAVFPNLLLAVSTDPLDGVVIIHVGIPVYLQVVEFPYVAHSDIVRAL